MNNLAKKKDLVDSLTTKHVLQRRDVLKVNCILIGIMLEGCRQVRGWCGRSCEGVALSSSKDD